MNKKNYKNNMLTLASLICRRLNFVKKMIKKIEFKIKIQCYGN